MVFSEHDYESILNAGKAQNYFHKKLSNNLNISCGINSLLVWKLYNEKPVYKSVAGWRGKSYREVNRELSKQDWQYL